LIRRHFKLADDRRVVCGISFALPTIRTRSTAIAPRGERADTVTFIEE